MTHYSCKKGPGYVLILLKYNLLKKGPSHTHYSFKKGPSHDTGLPQKKDQDMC